MGAGRCLMNKWLLFRNCSSQNTCFHRNLRAISLQVEWAERLYLINDEMQLSDSLVQLEKRAVHRGKSGMTLQTHGRERLFLPLSPAD